ncbi:uncharacterized protein EV154DRAFT_590169 [Mucor mucedo]|uniref:uncharacterized protein n=1 Tax=Mucor mucedo TaxID=29922 RepID=UPI0022208457|nr:uncharacterized protein EV154DRAFT_590169 [Mucor mucedo]KAI7890521.1 hypothetical protein EV154DRAFT_590169 [Mucor mucedo]
MHRLELTILKTVVNNSKRKLLEHYVDCELVEYTVPGSCVKSAFSSSNKSIFRFPPSPSHKIAGYSSIIALRKHLNLYDNMRPVKSANSPGLPNQKLLDMLIISENTEYLMTFDMTLTREKLRSETPVTNRFWKHNPRVTIIHKSNTARGVKEKNAEVNKGVDMEEQLVVPNVYRMFRESEAFDVVVALNLYGDIISDGADALVDSLGIAPSANIGDKFLMGELVHGSTPDIACKGISNPIASIRSAGILLEHMAYTSQALKIYNTVDAVMADASILTPDLGGKSSSSEVTKAVLKNLRA